MTDYKQFEVVWFDEGRYATRSADPAFPQGQDVDVTYGRTPACRLMLSYPGLRVGYYRFACLRCKSRGQVDTNGLADDPRSIKLPCQSRVGGI